VSQPENSYRADIDGLRALAVLGVVIFHAFPSVLPAGFVGVDVFFVISGFLISTIIFNGLRTSTFSFSDFYLRRIRRIFPALVTVLLFCFVLGWFTLAAEEYAELGLHIASGAAFITNFVLWKSDGYFDAAAETKPLLHLWSLAIEEQFYIVWPFLTFLMWKFKRSVLAIILFILLASFAFNIASVQSDSVASYYSPFTRFWEILFGVLIAHLALFRPEFLKNIQASSANKITLIATLLLGLGLAFISKSSQFPGWWAALPVIATGLFIMAGPQANINRTILSHRFLVWVGLISFPLYLWHWPLLTFARVLSRAEPSSALIVGIIALSFALSWLTFKWIEKPLRHGAKGGLKAASLCVTVFIVGAIGYNSFDREGLEFRAADQNFKKTGYDWRTGYRFEQCFLVDVVNQQTGFADLCAGDPKSTLPKLMIWGDSHGASIYPGFQRKSKELGFDLAQFTVSGCPPVVDFSVQRRPHCRRLNQFVLQHIAQYPPDVLILSAFWSMYDGQNQWSKLELDDLRKTVIELKTLGVKKIILFGHLPVHRENQTKIARRLLTENKALRSEETLLKQSRAFEAPLRELAKAHNISFVSPIELLCNPEGCLLSSDQKSVIPLAWDAGHLTEVGSVLLLNQALNKGLVLWP
jgi:peptidoglycan/LPS O-acetylase OafA/YrhL